MINGKTTEVSLYQDKEDKREEPEINHYEACTYDEWKEPIINYRNHFGDNVGLNIACFQQFENAIISCTKKDFNKIFKDLQVEQKYQE